MIKFVLGIAVGWIGKVIYDHIHYDYVDDDDEV